MDPYHIKVLVCDDNLDTCELLRNFLASEGYNVFDAGNYDDAIKVLAENTPDVALLDIRMPDVDGFCVAERIRFHNPHLPIIFMSAFESRFARIYAQTIEAHAFLQKPLDLGLLHETIQWAARNPLPKTTLFHGSPAASSSGMLAATLPSEETHVEETRQP